MSDPINCYSDSRLARSARVFDHDADLAVDGIEPRQRKFFNMDSNLIAFFESLEFVVMAAEVVIVRARKVFVYELLDRASKLCFCDFHITSILVTWLSALQLNIKEESNQSKMLARNFSRDHAGTTRHGVLLALVHRVMAFRKTGLAPGSASRERPASARLSRLTVS